MKTLSIASAIKYGIRSTWHHKGFITKLLLMTGFVFVALITLIILANLPMAYMIVEDMAQCAEPFSSSLSPEGVVVSGLWMWSQSSWWFYSAIFGLSILALSYFLTYFALGFICAMFELHDHEQSSVFTLFQPFMVGVRAYVASILFGIGFSIGMALIFIPGIIWALIFGFYLFVIADQKAGVIESFETSYEITSGARFKLLFLGIFLFLINIGVNSLFGLLYFVIFKSKIIMVLLALIAIALRVLLYFVWIKAFIYAYRVLQAQTNMPAVVE